MRSKEDSGMNLDSNAATTAYRWLWRYEEEGATGLWDRSLVPRRVRNRTAGRIERQFERLRRQGLIAWEIARRVGVALSTDGGNPRRLGPGRLSTLGPKPWVVRHERERPGELIHVNGQTLECFRRPGKPVTGDHKRHDRGAGWKLVHVCVHDDTRLARAEILADERVATAAGFLEPATAWMADHAVAVERLMTRNGSVCCSHGPREACRAIGLRHLRTRPCRPQTNGQAGRYIQTMLRQGAYAGPYGPSVGRRMM